ncbi:MAG: hypothetical protein AAF215_03440 [Cyanobacteria bacterium P01_A01_bin.123]
MPRSTILQPDQSYTFRSYYEMPYEPEDILAELGYRLLSLFASSSVGG